MGDIEYSLVLELFLKNSRNSVHVYSFNSLILVVDIILTKINKLF